MAGRRYAIIGDGAAGMAAVEALRRLDPAGSITVVSDDPHPTYFRAALTNYLLGELREDQIWAAPPTFYGDLGAERVFARVSRVDTAGRSVELASGAALPYEALLVASGARPRPGPFEGADLPGVLTLRTLQDARGVMDRVADRCGRAAVIGGGPLALEWAHALRERGLAVTLLVRGNRLMPEVLDAAASDLVLARLRRGGIDVRVGEEVAAALPGASGAVAGVRTRSGQTFACELVGVAIGVVCNTELLAGSGVALGPRGGVAVDDRMRTSMPQVFAAGDVAERDGRLLQLWEPARRTAEVAAANMAGSEATHAPGAHYFATRLHDLDFAAVGELDAAPGDVELVDLPRSTGQVAYRRLLLRGGRLRGALMIGQREAGVRRRGRLYQRLINLGADVGPIQGSLLDGTFDLRGWIETRALVARPPAGAKDGGARPADVRGTQRLTLGAAAAVGQRVERSTRAAAATPVDDGALPQTPAPLLSIGLRLPHAVAPPLEEAAAPAELVGAARTWRLDREVVSLGRGASATVCLDDPLVSVRHAEVAHHEGARFLRDAGSSNGTWVNGDRVTVPRALRPGDRIRLGGTELVFRGGGALPGAAKGSSPPLPPTPSSPTQPDAAAAPALEIRAGPGLGLRFALRGAQVLLGRDPASAIRLDDLSVSRRHALLAPHQGRWFVTDLHSSRGTRCNGVRLAPGGEAPLEDGDVLALGDVVLVFTHEHNRVG